MMQAASFWVAILLTVAAAATDTSAHICMITAPREPAYVEETSVVVAAQLPAHGAVSFSVNSVTSLSNRQRPIGCDSEEDSRSGGEDGLPLCKVQQQGLDVAATLERCLAAHPGVDWIILLEDDFMPCDSTALAGLMATLDTLDPLQTKFARFTQGSGGVAFPSGNVQRYAASVRAHIATQPYDRVLLEAWARQADFVFERHLFRHIGRVSTLAYRNSAAYLRDNGWLRDNECGGPIRV